MTQPDDVDSLRVGDQEREFAISVLHEAVGGGYLDLTEFDERARSVYTAKRRGDLRDALTDLPGGSRMFPPAAPSGGVSPVGSVVNAANRIDINWSTVKRKDSWQVPAQLFVVGMFGTADLDLRQAKIPPSGCVIEVLASWSTVKLRLGVSTIVRTHEFEGGSMTTLKDRAGPPLAAGGPVIDIRGHANGTSIRLRRD